MAHAFDQRNRRGLWRAGRAVSLSGPIGSVATLGEGGIVDHAHPVTHPPSSFQPVVEVSHRTRFPNALRRGRQGCTCPASAACFAATAPRSSTSAASLGLPRSDGVCPIARPRTGAQKSCHSGCFKIANACLCVLAASWRFDGRPAARAPPWHHPAWPQAER